MKKTIQRLKNERGLTLVELLAVIVILAIVAIIAFVFIGGIIENSKKDAHVANAQQIISAAKLNEATGGSFPVSADELKKSQHLGEILDPWNKTEYTRLGNVKVTKSGNQYTITNFNGKGCNIESATEQQLSDKGRELCTSGKPPTNK